MYELSAIQNQRSTPSSYEIHCRTGSGWEFWAIRGDMVDAISEAKSVLAQKGVQAVRVVRDVYDPTTNSCRPNTVFRAAAPAAR